MTQSPDLRFTRMPLNNGSGRMPALGFGTLIPDPALTVTATRAALETGFRHFDCAERYRNEREVGEALQAGIAAGKLAREDLYRFLAASGTPYVGVLYAGLMLTAAGPRLIEFNCRLGDPEAQAVLPLLDSDLAELALACCNGTLSTSSLTIREGPRGRPASCVTDDS